MAHKITLATSNLPKKKNGSPICQDSDLDTSRRRRLLLNYQQATLSRIRLHTDGITRRPFPSQTQTSFSPRREIQLLRVVVVVGAHAAAKRHAGEAGELGESGAVHERNEGFPDVRILEHGGADPEESERVFRRCEHSRERDGEARVERVLELADVSSALHRR